MRGFSWLPNTHVGLLNEKIKNKNVQNFNSERGKNKISLDLSLILQVALSLHVYNMTNLQVDLYYI